SSSPPDRLASLGRQASLPAAPRRARSAVREGKPMTRRFAVLAAAALLLLPAPRSEGKPFPPYVTLRQETANARVVLSGTLANPRPSPGEGSVDFVIDRVLKGGPKFAPGKVLRIDHYIHVDDPKTPPRFLVFWKLVNGKPDPYRSVTATPTLVEYLR